MTAKTPVFELEYIVEGEPLREARLALENNAKTTEAALVRGGIAPPAAQDLATLAGRVTTLEGKGTTWGVVTGQTDASGLIYFSHNLGQVPANVQITERYQTDVISSVFKPTVGAVTSTQVQIVAMRTDGTARLLTTNVSFFWVAYP
jgi:hypothetical protein